MGLKCREIRQIGGAGQEAEHAGARRLRIERAGQAEPENLREIVVEPHRRRAARRHLAAASRPSRAAFSSVARRRGIENLGHRRGVHELQILRDELDIDQPAGGIFEVPADRRRLSRSRSRRAFPPRRRRPRGVALAAQHVADRRLDARRECRRAPRRRARASAPYAPRSRPRVPDSRQSLRSGSRADRSGLMAAAACRLGTARRSWSAR